MKSLQNKTSCRAVVMSLVLQICLLLMLICLVPLKALAGDEGLIDQWYYEDGSNYPITDDAGLLTEDQLVDLDGKILTFESNYQTAIVILTVNDLGNRTAEEYADDFYDYKGFGYGENHEGLIFIVDMGSRAWQIETTGSATIEKFDDYTLEEIGNDCLSYLKDGDYYGCFDTFITDCDKVMTGEFFQIGFNAGHFFIAVVAGLILALIPLLFFVGQLRSVAPAKGASAYTTQELKLTNRKDQFLHHHVTRTKIEHESSGGSTTHTSSSGTSHGGTGGHF
ncbi:TPM domain-containing protein [Butyrivibrio sp. NC2002]|uniref:TPM domain-containing protein n=1 Tax=Butyrivibrio sp. NC2002 TaxID=1410610 RepID=UPI0018CC27D5|nr:TPM domain-containing protein [Butyrivibrio sp. NC2002]